MRPTKKSGKQDGKAEVTKRKKSNQSKSESNTPKPKRPRKQEAILPAPQTPAAKSNIRSVFHDWLDELCDMEFQMNYDQEIPVEFYVCEGRKVSK